MFDIERGVGKPRQEEEEEAKSFSPRQQHVLEWHLLELAVGKRTSKRRILHNVSGRVETGQLVILLAPSGAGKTSFLECLSLRNRNFLGAVHLDGKSAESDFFTKVAVVHQIDMHFGFLTPREHLTFQAIARMSDCFTRAQINDRVTAVLSELSLDKCADTIIGGTEPIFLKKGISGGERKRLQIGTELLLCPSILLLDEPTSGLDSVMAESVVQSLKSVADQGAAVLASLHSPSSSLARYFTHVLFLTGDGRLAFQGRYQDLEAYLEHSLGLQVPRGLYNTIDFVMEQLSRRVDEEARETTKRMDRLASAFQASTFAVSQPLPPENSHQQFRPVTGQHASLWTLTVLNIWRILTSIRRDVVTYYLWNMTKLSIGLVFGILYFDSAASSWRNMLGVLFLSTSSCLFLGGVGQAVTFPTEWPKVCREYMGGANAIGPYAVARVVYFLPWIPGEVLMATIIFCMTGMGPSAARYGLYILIMVLTQMSATAMGAFLASFSSNPLVGMALTPAVGFPMLTLAGIFYKRSAVPLSLRWIQSISIVNYSFFALLGSQAEILPPKEREAVLAFCEVDPSKTSTMMVVLLLISAVMYVMTYVSLRLRLVFTNQYL